MVALGEDEAALARYARELADAIDAALPGWVGRTVERLARAWKASGSSAAIDAGELAVRATAAGEAARLDVGAAVRRLLETDIDEQRTTPLALLRGAVRYPTEVLRAAGVPPVVRDEFAERAFPEDVYGLAPASFADVDPDLHEPGLVWGAAKAHVHLARRRQRNPRQ